MFCIILGICTEVLSFNYHLTVNNFQVYNSHIHLCEGSTPIFPGAYSSLHVSILKISLTREVEPSPWLQTLPYYHTQSTNHQSHCSDPLTSVPRDAELRTCVLYIATAIPSWTPAIRASSLCSFLFSFPYSSLSSLLPFLHRVSHS